MGHNSHTPKPMSATAATSSAYFNPSIGIRTCTAASTPTIAPSVLNAYTCPITFSPRPSRSSASVSSGNVMPAKNAAGNITATAITALATLYRP